MKRLEGDTNMILQKEITDILMSDQVTESFELMHNSGMLKTFLPEVAAMYGVEQGNKYHIYDVFYHTMVAIENAPKDPILRWAILLHDIGKPVVQEKNPKGGYKFWGHAKASAKMASNILKRLKFSKEESKQIIELIKFHDRATPTTKSIKKLLKQLRYSNIYQLIEIKKADTMGKNPEYINEKLLNIKKLEKEVELIFETE